MQTITVKQGQNFFDVVIEATGDLANLFAMAQANDITITNMLEIGTVLIVAGNIKTSITSLYGGNYAPATLFINTEAPIAPLYGFPETFPFL